MDERLRYLAQLLEMGERELVLEETRREGARGPGATVVAVRDVRPEQRTDAGVPKGASAGEAGLSDRPGPLP
ncbi:MAG: hypothetical protein HY705_03445, partial [Gemmatimonadetes bacterium]|nr:hypothetical protein [Gemmatimonadota bacterium]